MLICNLFQGEVQVLTGGIVRERTRAERASVRRSGVIPEPTVIVRMEETRYFGT